MEEYNEEVQEIRESYFVKEVDGTRYYNISSFGIRFDEPVNIAISGEHVSLVEANFVFGNNEVFSVETPVASVVNHAIIVTGYFYKLSGYTGYWPNGDYCFAITGYEEID